MADLPGGVPAEENDQMLEDRAAEREEKKAAKKAQNKKEAGQLKRSISWKDADGGDKLTEVKEFQAR
eukprot:scaffold219631_cov31-Prasinocladus_malaysianus.AAC.1